MYVSEQWSTLKWTTQRFLQSRIDLQVMASTQRLRRVSLFNWLEYASWSESNRLYHCFHFILLNGM